MKGSALICNSCGLLLLAQLAIAQNAIALPSDVSTPVDSVNILQVNSPSNLLVQRRKTPVRRTVKPVARPTQLNPVTAPPPPQVSGSDWALTTLQSLAERYGCSVPMGNQEITRTEFATSLNGCILKMEEAIATKAVEPVKEDIAALETLQQEFASELATLIIRLDEKADKATQFSTTTKLVGEVIFAAADTFGNNTAGSDRTVPVFGYRARLNFNTSFTGKDLLRIRLQAIDVPQFSGAASTGTNMTRFGFDGQGGLVGSANTGVGIHDFFYRFPISSNTNVWLLANAHGSENLAPNLSPISSSGRGAISRFARFSPIYRQVEGPGVAIQHQFSDQVNLSLAYRARNGTNAAPGNGIFNGNYGALAQLTVKPAAGLDVGVQYASTYFPAGAANVAGGTGSDFAQTPFAANTATEASTYGVVASYAFSPEFALSGWAGYTNAKGQSGTDIGRSASVSNWMVTLGFPDLGQKGNLGVLSVGMPPKATDNDNAARRDSGTSLHVEASYRHQVSENVAVTPGIVVITNPNHNSANPTQVVGVVRTTLSF